MRIQRLIFPAGLLVALSVAGPAVATCSHATEITNLAGTTLRIVELKSRAGGWFKSQWTGLKTIQPGNAKTINWTSDLDCLDGFGIPNEWDIKLYRMNGKTHRCNNYGQSDPVSLDTPDNCYQ